MPLAFGSGRNAAVTAGSSGDQELSYRIERSLRFNSPDLAYLTRTFTGTPLTYTFSCWVKRGKLSASQMIVGCRTGGVRVNQLAFNASDNLVLSSQATASITTTAVYRDPSAWYHIVVAVSPSVTTTGAILYVNGVQAGSATTDSTPSLFNSSLTNTIGRYGDTSSDYFDGYITEIHFVDGQKLTPSDFGETDAITGRWKAKAYSGTYGTNGFYLPFSNNSSTTTQNLLTYSEDFANAAWLNYESTDTSNASTAPNGTTTADKLIPNVGSTGGQIYRTYTATDNTTYTFSTYAKPDGFSRVRLYIQKKATSATYAYADYDLSTGTIETTFGSPSATTITSVGNGWYRISISTDVGTGGTSTPTVNIQHLGTTGNGSNGLLIWGAQLEANGTVGPYLYTGASTISSSLRVAQDMSISTGGYNSWVTNNLSVTAGVGNDSLVDSPTNYGTDTGVGGEVRGNYATYSSLSPVVAGGGSALATLANGNLDASSASASFFDCFSTFNVPSSGKWYLEWTITAVGTNHYLGIGSRTSWSSASKLYQNSGSKVVNGTTSSYGLSYTTNDVIGMALDMDAGTMTMYKNNSSQGVLASDLISAMPSDGWAIIAEIRGTASHSVNFGQRPFAYTAPSGFKALCTTNLPTPTIQKPSSYMDVVTYTGDGTSSRTITGLNFQPELIWIKNRTNAYNHTVVDSVRGGSLYLETNNTNADQSATVVSSFNSNGFQIGTSSIQVNGTSNTYVAWAWDEAPIAGMDIVSYTGTGVARTIAHNLGVAPKMMIVKNRNPSVNQGEWMVYHSSLSASGAVFLNLTNAYQASSTYWNNTAPTSSVFTVGTNGTVNENTKDFIAYLFAEVEGFSKFGSYTGNASTDGPFVWCGFRPRWIMIKASSTGGAGYEWLMFDTERSNFNLMNKWLLANSNQTEITDVDVAADVIDGVSSGFKLRGSDSRGNANGTTYIFAAFAESPFKYARAR